MEKIYRNATIIDINKGQLRGRHYPSIKTIEVEPEQTIFVVGNKRIDIGLNPQLLVLRKFRFSPGRIQIIRESTIADGGILGYYDPIDEFQSLVPKSNLNKN